MKIIDNTESKQYYLERFLASPPTDELELWHIIKFLSSYYDFIISDENIIICDKS
ncbi:MAG: hypothetical protein GOVbin2917_144 [Prokaryotic dsDNA virus sp.]|nr:MAG: hypothetical protein GOVbin2917_144 [Prokaryotic dsDNA virus sp.]